MASTPLQNILPCTLPLTFKKIADKNELFSHSNVSPIFCICQYTETQEKWNGISRCLLHLNGDDDWRIAFSPREEETPERTISTSVLTQFAHSITPFSRETEPSKETRVPRTHNMTSNQSLSSVVASRASQSKKPNIVIGAQWGDEGKGKLVDSLSTSHTIVARYNGGANAGHTIIHDGKKFALNLLPSGIIQSQCRNLIGNGVVLHIPKLLQEIEDLKKNGVDPTGKLFISDRTHLLFDFHQIIDGLTETKLGKDQIGTTKKGIGPCYSSKMIRNNLRAGDFRYWTHFEQNLRRLCLSLQKKYGFEYDVEAEIERYKNYRDIILPMLVDGVEWMHERINEGEPVLLEGANAVMLDVDFGTYPFVTSSSPCVGGACTGLGIPPNKIGEAYGVVKAYCTRVGAGPFPTELHGELDNTLRDSGHEYGTTTGRPRRCGWLDLVQVKYAHRINDFHSICLTKLDCLNVLDEIKLGVRYMHEGKELTSMPSNLETLSHVEVEYETFEGFKGVDVSKCRKFEELPESAQRYVKRIEEILGVPIRWIGVGPERNSMIERQ